MGNREVNALASPVWVELAELKTLLSALPVAAEIAKLERYYLAAWNATEVSEEWAAVSLFKDTLDSIIEQQAVVESDPLVKVYKSVADYVERCKRTAAVLAPVQPEVPKIMHFVWVGGSEVGAIQRDYMNIWRAVLPDGHRFNLWYDSDALLAFEMNRVILESARVHAMESGGATATLPNELARMIERRARVLKQQMATHLAQPQWRGRADEARIDLMVRAYDKDQAVLTAFRQKCLDSHLAMAGTDLRLCDVRDSFKSNPLWDVYEREVAMRGNFAAASDVVRLLALELEGGRYSDMDYLPPLAASLGGVNMADLDERARIGVLQLLLNHQDTLMPGRDRHRYDDRTGFIPAEHQEALRAFAQSAPDLQQIFKAPEDHRAPMDSMRLAGVLASDMNSHILAQPRSGSVQMTLALIRFNYDCLAEVERRVARLPSGFNDAGAVAGVILDVVMEAYEKLPYRSLARQNFLGSVAEGIGAYYMDGIRPDARGTIAMTGPGATVVGLQEYAEQHLTAEGASQARTLFRLREGFNEATEEDKISGWTVNGDPGEWLKQEQDKWAAGRYKTRYNGDFGELLKEQMLTFEKGWPVLEGRAVLRTDLLQRWADQLGEPFIRAMNDKLTGDVHFDTPLGISFDERLQVRAQPVVELPLSIGAQPIGNLNEMLSRIAHGSLPLDQLSPVDRVFLGGVFGAESLDNGGFAEAWQNLLDMARNTAEGGLAQRYIAIEQALLSHRSAAFEAGFAAGRAAFKASEQDANGLKVLAFAQPLTARQWGEQVAHIRLQAEHELRSQIFTRSAAVLEGFIAVGASTAKLMPQGLLVRGEGDPGRHCYPLVLAMASALSRDAAAVDALSGRLANANLDPEARDTHAFLATLKDLRTVPMAEFGSLLGTSHLGLILESLQASTSSKTLMLNTDSHSMLIAKLVDGESSTYRFYDPNFGLFGFLRAQDLRRGIEQLLSDPELARLYDFSPSVDTTFNVIDLDGSRIADTALPSNIRVADLLGHGSITSATVAPWKHHAALRTRALSENARLGRGLSELDARHWARQIERSATRLYGENALGRDFVPVFESVSEVTKGRYEISLVHRHDAGRSVRVSSTDSVLARIKAFLSETFQTLSVKPFTPGVIAPTDVNAVHTLTAAFTVQALLMALKYHEESTGIDQDRSLTTAVRIHGYLSYAQLAHGNVVDLVELVSLVGVALKDASLVARTTSSVVVNALGHIARDGLATVLQLATVGFDIYLLANARNDFERAQYGTQLAFDATGLALSAAGIGAGLAGASTAAAFLGGAGVILGGLAIGVGALVEGFNGTLDRGQQIGRYLHRIRRAYATHSHAIKEGVFYPSPYAHISEIDLRQQRLTFDGQEIFAADNYSVLHVPNADPDRSKAINIRRHFGLAEHADLADLSTFQTLVLPCVAKTYFGFDYSALPFSTTRREHLETALELEYDADGKRQFWFTFYLFPSEYIMHNLYPVPTDTTITVRLDEAPRVLLVPELPKVLHGKLSYRIEGLGGHCVLVLNPGVGSVNLSHAAKASAMAWTLRAAWLSDEQMFIEPGRLTLGGLVVEVAGTPEVSVQLAEKTLRVDWVRRQWLFDELASAPHADTATLKAYVRQLARAHRLASPLTAVQNFLVPFTDPDEPQRTMAYYEQAQDRFIYSRDLPPEIAAQARLGAVVGDQAYFYAPQQAHIWRVDVVTGRVNCLYRLMDPVPGSMISVVQDLGQGVIRVVQQLIQRSGREVEVTYLLAENEALLMSIAGHLTPRQHDLLRRETLGAWSNFFWDYELLVRRSVLEPLIQVPIVDYHTGAFTSITGLTDGKRDRLSTWVRGGDQLLIRPHVPSDEGPGGAISPLLLTPGTRTGDTFLFYDKANRTLYRQKVAPGVTGLDAQAQLLPLPSVVETIINEGRYIALTRSGLYFDLDDHGHTHLAGVTEDWLDNAKGPIGQAQDWWAELDAVAVQHQASSVTILGLDNATADATLCAWYVEKRLLLVDLGAGKVVRLLGVTADNQAAWVLDVSSGRIYRQAFIDPQFINELFAGDFQLLRSDLVPTPQSQWPEWAFTQVWAHEAGLRGRTESGLDIEMFDGEPARIVKVSRHWLAQTGSQNPYGERAIAALNALANEHPHVPFIQVEAHPGRHWYVSSVNRVLGESFTYLETRMLGVRGETEALLHEVPSRLTYSLSRDLWWQRSVARREDEVLLFQGEGAPDDLLLLIPDEVTQLILSNTAGVIQCRIPAALWQRLECIVLDGRLPMDDRSTAPGTVMLETGTQDRWRVDRTENHVLLTDPDTGHSLVMRDVLADDRAKDLLNLSLQVLGITQLVSLGQLLAVLDDNDADPSLATLVTRINAV